MTTPVYFLAAERIITYAYRDAGILGKMAEPNGAQLAEGINRLNDLINLWQTQGLKLWTVVDTAVTLVASQAKYTFKPSGSVNMTKPLKAIHGYLLGTSDNKTPLNSVSWEAWSKLSPLTSTGTPSSFFVDKQATSLDISFWPVPDATAALGTAHIVLQLQVTNFVGLTDHMNFPMEWAIALRWGLADDLSTGQPQEIVDRCEKRAHAFRAALEDWDVEDGSVYFTPDSRMGQPSNFAA